ncbi:MAG: hypothetical protein R3F43_25190 [bacterium]
MLRRHRAGTWFGWLAVTLQRHERRDEGGDWLASAIDQALLLNLVLGRWPTSGRSARAHYHTGRPERKASRSPVRLLPARPAGDRTWIHDAWQIDSLPGRDQRHLQPRVCSRWTRTACRTACSTSCPPWGARGVLTRGTRRRGKEEGNQAVV